MLADKHSHNKHKLRWLKLDNAAKIFPASRRRHWVNVFRLSATLTEVVDPEILQSAFAVTAKRFPMIAARLRRGAFWYYLEEIREVGRVMPDYDMPLRHMPLDDISKCAIRVLYYDKRIAVEFFHSVTDGNGGLVFLKSLVAEYLEQTHGIHIPCTDGVLDRNASATDGEMEDSFLRYRGDHAAKRSTDKAYHIIGTMEPDRFLHLTCGQISTSQALALSKSYGVSLTTLISAVMIQSIAAVQKQMVAKKKWRPVRLAVPVNLRKMFPSTSLRNFIMVCGVGIDPKMGDYSPEEILATVKHQMGLSINRQNMQSEFTVNVNSERNPILKIVPLFIKNIVMRMVFDAVGERLYSLSLSNLGNATLPDAMSEYVSRFDFVLSPQSCTPYNCGVIGYKDHLNISLIRNCKEPILEREFFTRLRDLGLCVTLESNERLPASNEKENTQCIV